MKRNLWSASHVVACALAAGLILAGCSSQEDAAQSPSAAAETPDGASAAVGVFELVGFWVKESSLDLAAGFGTIMNTGATDDALVGATAEGVPAVEFHQTVDGVMRQVESFPVPADGAVILSPNGNHLMFVGLTDPLTVGESVDITLQFASGATASITAPVEPFSGEDGHGSEDHKE